MSLVEVLIAIMMIGISLLALVSLVYGTMASSVVHRARVRAAERASDLAERIDNLRYIPCPAAGTASDLIYRSAIDDNPDPRFEERIVSVQFLNDGEASASSFGPCIPAGDQGVQRITVEVKTVSPPGVASTLVFVKRDMTCPVGSVEVTC